MFETGVGIRNPLFFVGVIENRFDERLEGRVKVRAFGIHGSNQQVPTEDLPWAKCVSGNYDPNHPLPGVNDWVFGVFLDGREAQQPLILGLIPTQFTEDIDPEVNGWGVIPSENVGLDSPSTRAENYGQSQNSRLARAEDLQDTYIMQHLMGRTSSIRTAGSESTIEEPVPAYNAQYPYNRVTETPGGHCIELDDTPGAERIMIWHKSGSYVQVDARGTKVDKSVSDRYEVNDRNQHVIVGGNSIVTIQGDARVLVQGNKTEEVSGDLVQIVHGNHFLSVGGQINLNSSEEVQMRGAQIRMEANVAGINMKAAKSMFAETGESMHLKSGIAIFQDATNSINIKAGDNIYTEASGAFNLTADTSYITAAGANDINGGHVKIGGGSKVSINSSIVAIDDIVLLSSGESDEPEAANPSTAALSAPGTEMPEPPNKSVSVRGRGSSPSRGGSGIVSKDDTAESSGSSSTEGDISVPEGILTYDELFELAKSVGFTDSEARIMAAIALGESSGDPNALNSKPPDLSYGLWQMNLLYDAEEVQRRKSNWNITENEELYDPVVNARAAYQLYNEQGFGAWSVYKNGAYKQYLP